ncbi:MAG: hypothetical protein WDM81_11880 [Rhizomicrobium sp.]
MRIEHQPNVTGLSRDWLGARIVGAAGLVLILAVAGLATLNLVSRQSVPPPSAVASPQALAAARRQEDVALCDAALAAAQGLGVVPSFAVRDGDMTSPVGWRVVISAARRPMRRATPLRSISPARGWTPAENASCRSR